tara:strand:+ start:4439 stop:5215 length:777 start_codon:yes stop_codon:yes gene_type:complete
MTSLNYQKNIKNLRFFHNKIKLYLLKQVCGELNNTNISLFDIGVGRGGDILKWERCGIRKVIGFDPDQTSIDDANKRIYDRPVQNCNISLFCCPSIEYLELQDASFSIISCQFAIHYFFETSSKLRNMLKHVKRLISKHGYFIGSFMNANKINEYLQDNVYINEAMMIKKMNSHQSQFGEVIHVHLSGTLYFAEDCVSIEYMVYPDILIKECNRIGLDLVEIKPFEQHLKHMNEYNIQMDEHHKICSFMYSSFIFRNT